MNLAASEHQLELSSCHFLVPQSTNNSLRFALHIGERGKITVPPHGGFSTQIRMLILVIIISTGVALHGCAKDGSGEGWGGHSGAADER
jgi:hypothetical protein